MEEIVNDAKMRADEERMREATTLILKMAPSFMGAHSETGAEVAAFLKTSFPLNMVSLCATAMKLGHNPKELWPWSITAGDL